MGRVFLAEDELLRRPVALKQQVADAVAEEFGTRMLDEARSAARVNHSGTVTVYDIVSDGGKPWIVMEPLSGRTLAETITATGALSVSRVTHLAVRLLDVVDAVHRADVIHRDIKPSNVHICDDGRVVLTDFGIACVMGEEPALPRGGFSGSPPYVSPEILRGAKPGPASDLFSLGATLFAAVEGKAPLGTGDVFDTITAVIEAPPAPFVRAGQLRPVIDGLLDKDPGQRLTIRQARAALSAVTGGQARTHSGFVHTH